MPTTLKQESLQQYNEFNLITFFCGLVWFGLVWFGLGWFVKRDRLNRLHRVNCCDLEHELVLQYKYESVQRRN